MKMYFSLSILLYIFVIFLFGLIFCYHRNQFYETFITNSSSSQRFQDCVNKGFSKEFCIETPTLRYGPNTCICHDGSIGFYSPGFAGQCVCNSTSFYFG